MLVVVALLSVFMREPRRDRNWDADVRELAQVDIAADESSFSIRRVRDWQYGEAGPQSTAYFDAHYRLEDLAGMVFFEQVLDGRGIIAHTFVVFEFDGSYKHPHLGVSVETRREVGERYSLLKGALRGFELMHTWATEADLVQRRVLYLNYTLTKYRVTQDIAHQRAYLLAFLRETAALATSPRWYNTITSNCTNVVIKTANRIEPGALPFDKAYVLTGLADDYLIERGILAMPAVATIERRNVDAYIEMAAGR